MDEFKVRLLGYTDNPQSLSVAGALGCFEEKSSNVILDELNAMSSEARRKKEKGVLKNSFGRGHGAVGDQNYFIFSIENLPRVATLFLCAPEHLSHLQQSLRRATASRDFYLPEQIKKSDSCRTVEKGLSGAFELYEKMKVAGVPGEDARFILPLYTRTNIQTAGDARELCHLRSMAQDPGVPSIVKKIVEEMIKQAENIAPYLFEDFGFNYEKIAWRPAPLLFAVKNEAMRRIIEKSLKGSIGTRKVVLISTSVELKKFLDEKTINKAVQERNEAEISILKHIHFDFLFPISLAGFHQVTRQRTWHLAVESVYKPISESNLNPRIVTPPSIVKSSFYKDFLQRYDEMMNLTQRVSLNSESVGLIPHAFAIYVLAHIDGWNAIHSIGKRTCKEAQWEIRGIAWEMAKIIRKEFPALGKWVKPQCIAYGKCPEKEDCGYYKKK